MRRESRKKVIYLSIVFALLSFLSLFPVLAWALSDDCLGVVPKVNGDTLEVEIQDSFGLVKKYTLVADGHESRTLRGRATDKNGESHDTQASVQQNQYVTLHTASLIWDPKFGYFLSYSYPHSPPTPRYIQTIEGMVGMVRGNGYDFTLVSILNDDYSYKRVFNLVIFARFEGTRLVGYTFECNPMTSIYIENDYLVKFGVEVAGIDSQTTMGAVCLDAPYFYSDDNPRCQSKVTPTPTSTPMLPPTSTPALPSVPTPAATANASTTVTPVATTGTSAVATPNSFITGKISSIIVVLSEVRYTRSLFKALAKVKVAQRQLKELAGIYYDDASFTVTLALFRQNIQGVLSRKPNTLKRVKTDVQKMVTQLSVLAR